MVVRRQLEPFLWVLFSAGGVLAALMMPALILLFGVAFPLGWAAPPAHDDLLGVLGSPLTRVALVLLITLSFFHWAHRFRYTLYDGLQIKHLNEVIRLLCYGGAILGSIVAVYVVWMIP